jgi:hypothetical protein
MLETPLDNEQQEFADLVQTSADSLLSLINDILDLTRVESGKLELEYFDFDIHTTVEVKPDGCHVIIHTLDRYYLTKLASHDLASIIRQAPDGGRSGLCHHAGAEQRHRGDMRNRPAHATQGRGVLVDSITSRVESAYRFST